MSANRLESGFRGHLSLLDFFRLRFDWLRRLARRVLVQTPERIGPEKRFQLVGGRCRLEALLAHWFHQNGGPACSKHEPFNNREVARKGQLRYCRDVATVAKSEVLVALPTWLVGELPRLEEVSEPGFLFRECYDGVADTVLLEQDSEEIVAHDIHDLEIVGLV
jgi:hypothetical protein